MLLAATIELGATSIPVKLRNLSEQGALIEGPRLPLEGSDVLFRRNELEVAGRIAWVSGKQAGIAFAAPLSTQDVLRNVPQPKPRVTADYRRPGSIPGPCPRRSKRQWNIGSS
ncbi:PilZ domain-containing protein [Sphingomonas piscis]|uniref:PilZ domain-containing protein n=1 Tax=Sphingomonas piscis TaxID=2714943 RepID=A0A6G7YLT2_9SPHN|nr:PilZ domain-containing protein [Sphingomonas piscis]QIK77705.1 PilZ domain-containing protein [Sphingomonas piscis]